MALVGDAGDERGLRPDDDEVEMRYVERAQFGRDADVVPVPGAGPGDRLLPPTAADDVDAHQASTPSNASFAGAICTGTGYWPWKQALQ